MLTQVFYSVGGNYNFGYWFGLTVYITKTLIPHIMKDCYKIQ